MKFISGILKMLVAKIKKILWILGLHAFWLILLFVFVDFILGSFILYKYVFLADREEPKVSGSIIKFDYKTYQEVIGELQARERDNYQ